MTTESIDPQLRHNSLGLPELVFQEAVIAARLLFFTQLQTITNQLGLAILAMLAGSEIPLLDGTLFGVAALPF